MRTLGNLPHPTLKITLLHHGRYLLKVEDRDVEVVFRFRDGEGVASLEEAQRALDLGLLQDAERQLRELAAARTRYLRPSSAEEEFPLII